VCSSDLDEFDIAKLRYHKIILMCDADIDGSHIRTLILTFFYKEMQELIKNGHIYIAQPPLYKIKRGKREEYIQTEDDFNNLLLELGTEGVTLTRTKDKNQFTDKQLKSILDGLIELQSLSNAIDRRGVGFSKYLSFRHKKTKKLPLYMINVEGEDHFLYNDDELADYIKESGLEVKSEEKKPSAKEATSGKAKARAKEPEKGEKKEGPPAEKTKAINYIEFYEVRELEKIIEKLEKLGVDVEDYDIPEEAETAGKKEGKQEAKKPLYKIEKDKEHKPFLSLREILRYVMSAGKEGMTIQRYKGLGEMNPEQLWDTTMDPEKRTVLKVTLEDAVAADRMFTVLMGEAVEPRREFIEKHAHEEIGRAHV
jgi:DNA gyrase subunit B